MKIALILGNGFDLNLGLPTSFRDFLKSHYFRNLLPDNKLCQYMQNVADSNMGWVDVEYELANYSMIYPKDADLKYDYIDLRQALADYIGEVDYEIKEIDTDSQAYLSFGDYFFGSVGQHRNDSLVIINFNYTHSITKLKRRLYGNGFMSRLLEFAEALSPLMGEDNPFSDIKFLYPHGAVDTGIVFGVDDAALISPKHTFLKKSTCLSYDPFNPNILQRADKVIFWGHSLGESDHAYFIDFFSAQASGHSKRKEIVVTYYGEDGYDSLIEQLDVLTNHNIRGLKVYNSLKLVDSSSQECRWKL